MLRFIRSATPALARSGLALLLCFLIAPVLARDISGRVVDQNGKGVAQAIVFVATPTPADHGEQRASLDQVNKAFVPSVLPIEVGTQVRFPNHDQIHHHVYSFSRTKTFELPLYKGQDAPPVTFDKPGVVKVGCNIHDWMSAVILVLPNSHYTTTDAEGNFKLSGLTAGTYELQAWHERSRTEVPPIPATLASSPAASPAANITFQLSLGPERARPAMRGLRSNQ